MSSLKLGIQAAAVLVIGALTLVHNPTLFSAMTLQEQVKKKDEIWNVVSFTSSKGTSLVADVSQVPDIFYRQDGHRTARFLASHLKFDLKKKWSSETFNIGIHAASKSSPISDGKLIFVGSDTSWFYCYDLEGNLQWRFYFGSSDRGVHSTALVDSNAVYIGSSRGAFYKINKYTGALIWTRVLGQAIGASPLSVGDDIVLSAEMRRNDSYLVRIEKKTGQIVWRSDLLGEPSQSSVVYDRETDFLYLGAQSTIQAIDFKTGRRVYSLPTHGKVKSSPVAEAGDVYFTSGGRDVISVKMATGTTNWNGQMDSKSQVSPVVLRHAKLLVTADSEGKIYAFDLKSGKLKWKKQIYKDPSYNQSSSLIVLYDQTGSERILFSCKPAVICLMDEFGKLEREWPVEGVVSSVPFWGGSFLVLSLDEMGLEFLSVLN